MTVEERLRQKVEIEAERAQGSCRSRPQAVEETRRASCLRGAAAGAAGKARSGMGGGTYRNGAVTSPLPLHLPTVFVIVSSLLVHR